MAKKSKKQKFKATEEGGFVYSTNSNFAFEGLASLLDGNNESDAKPTLDVHLEKKHRGGKAAIIIRGFAGTEDELNELGKKLKTSMGVGGSAKDGEIIIQGDRRDKAMELLEKWGYKTKRIGG